MVLDLHSWSNIILLSHNRAQQSQLEFSFAPDKAPATVPTEMFSNDIESEFHIIKVIKMFMLAMISSR